jgi:hypothetical protein
MKRIAVVLSVLAATGAFGQQPRATSGPKLDAGAKRAFVEKALSLRAGDSRETVIERLGKPAIDRTTTMSGNRTLARTLKYYVRTGAPGGAALDEYIDVYLDKSNRVDGIYLSVELR